MTEQSEPTWLVCERDGGVTVSIEYAALKRELAKHGLHLVTDADKRVLDEMANAGLTRNRDGARFKTRAKEKAVCEAELARRGEKA